jgi:hypothetical protein
MAMIEGGLRTKGTFTVAERRPHTLGAYYEYRLVNAGGKLYKNGAWVRERHLHRESS